MNVPKNLAYRSVIGLMRLYRDTFLDLHVTGRENIPPGPKIYATNHISSTDPYWVLPEFPEPVHVVIGPGYNSRVLAWVLDLFEQINARPEHRKSVVDRAAVYLERGESIYNAPEGDIQTPFTLGPFYPGLARIYRRTGAPIIPIALVAPQSALRAYPRFNIEVDGRLYRAIFVLRGSFAIRIGTPFMPDLANLDDLAITEQLRTRIQNLVDEVRAKMGW